MNVVKVKLILAEDHSDLRAAIMNLIKKRSDQFELLDVVANGVALLNAVKKSIPDLVVTDIQMPEMDGLTACAEITKQFPGVKVVIFSALEESLVYDAAIKAGASGYMPKNIDKEAFFETIIGVANGKPAFTGGAYLF